MLPWAAGDKKTIIREFDPSQGKVVATFELPASMWEDVTAIPSGVTSRLPSMACSGGLVWLNTTRDDAKTDSPPGNAFVEGIDWEKQKVVASLEVRQFPPPRSQVFLGLYPVGNHCVVIRRELSFDERGMPHKGKIDAVLVWEGGNSEPLDLPAGFGLVAAGKSQLLATVGTEGGILKIDVDSRQHRLSVSGPFKAAELAAGGRGQTLPPVQPGRSRRFGGRLPDRSCCAVSINCWFWMRPRLSLGSRSQFPRRLTDCGSVAARYSGMLRRTRLSNSTKTSKVKARFELHIKEKDESGAEWRVVDFTP